MPVLDTIKKEFAAPVATELFLKVSLDEPLSVVHFESILFRVRESYDTISRFMKLFETLEMSSGEYLDDIFYNPLGLKPISSEIPWKTFVNMEVPLADFLPFLNRFINPMMIKRIKIESPGFGEFVGNLNPLKVIADCFTNFRAKIRKE